MSRPTLDHLVMHYILAHLCCIYKYRTRLHNSANIRSSYICICSSWRSPCELWSVRQGVDVDPLHNQPLLLPKIIGDCRRKVEVTVVFPNLQTKQCSLRSHNFSALYIATARTQIPACKSMGVWLSTSLRHIQGMASIFLHFRHWDQGSGFLNGHDAITGLVLDAVDFCLGQQMLSTSPVPDDRNGIRGSCDIALRLYLLCYALLSVPHLVHRFPFSEAVPRTSYWNCSDDLAEGMAE